MPLAFLSKQLINDLKRHKIEVLYEEWSKTIPRSINGFPIFPSFKTLTWDEWEKVLTLSSKIQAAMDAVIGEDAKQEE